MRTCQSCGKENPRTAISAAAASTCAGSRPGRAGDHAGDGRRRGRASRSTQGPGARSGRPGRSPAPGRARHARRTRHTEHGNGHGNGHAAPPPAPPAPPPPPIALARRPSRRCSRPRSRRPRKTLVRGAVPRSRPRRRRRRPTEPATIVLRLPDGDPAKGETLHLAVEPGQRERVLALVRNQSGIVDNYDLRVEGMPRGLVVDLPRHGLPRAVRLGGTYEQEVEIHLHPPRSPEAEARVWDLQVVADSKAHQIVAASAPLALHIQPYIETATTLRPQRRKGRRKADLRRHGDQQGQRAGAGRARRRGPRRRAAVRLQPPAAGDPARAPR